MISFLTLLLAAFAMSSHVSAQESGSPVQHHHPPEHAQLHQNFYSKLERPDVPSSAHPIQRSCCSDRDCRPARARFRNGSWEFLDRGIWRPVEPTKVLQERSPDTRAHACIAEFSRELLCFVKPDFGI